MPLNCLKACDLGKRLHQHAIDIVDNDGLWVVACEAPNHWVWVGAFRDRLDHERLAVDSRTGPAHGSNPEPWPHPRP